jgi:predicted CXXCH cytochrome family protein
MGRSLTPVAVDRSADDNPDPNEGEFDAGGFHYRIETRDGSLIHTESRLGSDGKVVAASSHEIAYVIGSGTHGRSYLVERDGVLTQSPITWYAKDRRFDFSPGFQHGNAHFERPIGTNCLFCHANRVKQVPGSINRYEPPIFLGHAIGCERCHGPGSLHVKNPGRGESDSDQTIVNPAVLEPALRDAVCEQCHLQGDARVEPFGRKITDYRPGLPLHRFVTVFFDGAISNKVRAVGQVEQMHASKCYQESKGALGCISCHDPHEKPSAELRVSHFRERCLACHDESRQTSCALAPEVRRAQSAEDSCIQCHMPRMPSTDIVHNSGTDHTILRRQPVPDRASTVIADASGSDHPETSLKAFHESLIQSAEERAELGRALGIALIQKASRPESDVDKRKSLARRAWPLLVEALRTVPEDHAAAHSKALALNDLGRARDAYALLRETSKKAPHDESLLEDTAALALQWNRPEEAQHYAERLIALNPYRAEYPFKRALALTIVRDRVNATAAAKAALRLDPFHQNARILLIESLLHQGQDSQAREELDRLQALNLTDPGQLERWFVERRRDADTSSRLMRR